MYWVVSPAAVCKIAVLNNVGKHWARVAITLPPTPEGEAATLEWRLVLKARIQLNLYGVRFFLLPLIHHMCKEIDIDDPGLTKAIDDLKTGDTLIIQGKGGPMTMYTPLYVDPEKEMEEFRKTYDPSKPRDESWFD